MDITLLLVYLVYGLAFFGMGIAMLLETGRTPALARTRLLLPLAAFGLIHGTHELLEIFVLQAGWLDAPLAGWIDWLRIGLLFSSFIALLYYGLQAYRAPEAGFRIVSNLCLAALIIYMAGIMCSAISTYGGRADIDWQRLSDTLVRYLLAVPGAILASIGLRTQAREAQTAGRLEVSRDLTLASVAFGLYGISQIFVPVMEMPPASLINAAAFREWTGLPIQSLRALMAVLATVGLARATKAVERERQERALTDLRERESLRRELLQHTVHAQEEERARIARELHDETSQVLAAFSLDLGALQNGLPARSALHPLVDRLQAHSRQISQGIYRLVRDLRPAQLDDLGLIAALKYLIDQEFRDKGLDIRLDLKGDPRRIDPLLETVLFRVAQEACTNILRHARTNQAYICLTFDPAQARLEIRDQGAGFDAAGPFRPPRGWGLAGMRERIEAVGGELQIASAPGQGTTIVATIPIQNMEAH